MALKNKYGRTIVGVNGDRAYVDVYSVLVAFDVRCPAIAHAIKKLLMPGARGAKTRIQDLDEARESLSRAIAMETSGAAEARYNIPPDNELSDAAKRDLFRRPIDPKDLATTPEGLPR